MAAVKGILITCLITFVVFMVWFIIREEVFHNRDDLISMVVQIVVCAALLFAGSVMSIVRAFGCDKNQLLEQKQSPTGTDGNQGK